MNLSLIVAMTRDYVIGIRQNLPWHIPEDLRRFKKITTGHPIIMGRKTFESIGKPLPNRTNIVVTHNQNYETSGIKVVHSLDDALAFAEKSMGSEEIFIIGGSSLFREALPMVKKLYITWVEVDLIGDTYFPREGWQDNFEFEVEEEGETQGSPSIPFCFTVGYRK